MSPDRHARTMLPIPDRPSFGLTTYDAKDPDTAYPPIEPLLPPEGAPNVLIVLLDDVCSVRRARSVVRVSARPPPERRVVVELRYEQAEPPSGDDERNHQPPAAVHSRDKRDDPGDPETGQQKADADQRSGAPVAGPQPSRQRTWSATKERATNRPAWRCTPRSSGGTTARRSWRHRG